MRFPHPLVQAKFIRREKRFLIHALLADGTPVIAHTNNTGRMTGCLWEGGTIWLSPAQNPARKLAWTLEMSETPKGTLIGVNTQLANKLVAEGLRSGLVGNFGPQPEIRAEVSYPTGNSRADFLVNQDTWVEVKNTTLVAEGHARFPDAPTARGRKHLLDLQGRVAAGDHALLVFCIQRGDAQTAGPADDVDPEYGRLLRQAKARGVEITALQTRLDHQGIFPEKILRINLNLPEKEGLDGLAGDKSEIDKSG